jgi:SAM-dependent methyltransferase
LRLVEPTGRSDPSDGFDGPSEGPAGKNMESDRKRWNRRYRERESPEAPAAIVREFFPLAAPGRALDIAAGTGRNARFLAERGFTVDAVDISDVAADRLRGLHPRVNAIRADLDRYTIAGERYQLVVNIRFLLRRLFPYLVEGLAPGGLLIFETFIEAPPGGDGPANRDYLLRENELLHAFLSLRILWYREQEEQGEGGPYRIASLVARRGGPS